MMTDKYADKYSAVLNGGALGIDSSGSGIAPRQDFASSVAQAKDRAWALADRIEVLADRLVGTAPENTGSPTNPTPNGILLSVRGDGESICAAVERAHNALARIEKALP